MADAEVAGEGGRTTEVEGARARLDEAVAVVGDATDEAKRTRVRGNHRSQAGVDRAGEADGAGAELVISDEDGAVSKGQAGEGGVEVRALGIDGGGREGRHEDGVVDLTGAEVIVAGRRGRGRPEEVARVDELGIRHGAVGADAVGRRIRTGILHLEATAASLVMADVDDGVVTRGEVDRAERRRGEAYALTGSAPLASVFSGDLYAVDGQATLVVLRSVEGVDTARGDLERTRVDEGRVELPVGYVGDDRRREALIGEVAQESTRDDGTGGLGGVGDGIQRGVRTAELATEGRGQPTLGEASRCGGAVDRLDCAVDDVRHHEHRERRPAVDGDGLARTEGRARGVGQLCRAVVTRGRAVQRRVERDGGAGREGVVAAEEDAAVTGVDRTGRIREAAADQGQVGVSRGEDLQARGAAREQRARAREGHGVRRPADAGEVEHRVRGEVQRTHQDRVDLVVAADVEDGRSEVGVEGHVVAEGDDGVVAEVRAEGKLAAVHRDGASAQDVGLTGLLEADQGAVVQDDAARGRGLRQGVITPASRGGEARVVAEPQRAGPFLGYDARAAHAAAEHQQGLRGRDADGRVRRQGDVAVEIDAADVLQREAAVDVQLVGEVRRTLASREEGAVGDVERREAQRTLIGTADADIGARGGRGQRRADGEVGIARDRRDDRACRDADAADFHADDQAVGRSGGDDRLASGAARSGGDGKHQRLVEAEERLDARVSGRGVAEEQAAGVEVEGTGDLIAAGELQHAGPRLGDGRGVRQVARDVERDRGPRREGDAIEGVRVDLDGRGRAAEVDLTAEFGHRAVEATTGDDDGVGARRQGQEAGRIDEGRTGAAVVVEDELGQRVGAEERERGTAVDGHDVRRVDLARTARHGDVGVRDGQATGRDDDHAGATVERRAMGRGAGIPALEDRATRVGVGRGHRHAAAVVIEGRDEANRGVGRVIDDGRVERQVLGVGVDVEVLQARGVERAGGQATAVDGRVRRTRKDTAADDVQRVGAAGEVDGVGTTELEGVDGQATRGDVLRRTQGDVLRGRGAGEQAAVVIASEAGRVQRRQAAARDVAEEISAAIDGPATDEVIDEARVGLSGGDKDAGRVVAEAAGSATGIEHRVRRGADEVRQRQDGRVADRRQTAGRRGVGADVRGTARQGGHAEGFGADGSDLAVEGEEAGAQRDRRRIHDAVREIGRRGGGCVIDAELRLVDGDARGISQGAAILQVEDVLRHIGRARVGLRIGEDLELSTCFLDGKVTRENATEEVVRRVVEDEVRGRGRGIGDDAARIDADIGLGVAETADGLGRAVQIQGRTRRDRQITARVEGVVAGVQDDLTCVDGEPAGTRVEVLLGAELQRARQGLGEVDGITERALDVEGRVGVHAHVEVVGSVGAGNDEVGTNDVGDRRTDRAAGSEEAAVRQGQRTETDGVERDRAGAIHQHARGGTRQQAGIARGRVTGRGETDHIGRRAGDGNRVEVRVLILKVIGARGGRSRGELVGGGGQDGRDGGAFRNADAVNRHADREAEGGADGDDRATGDGRGGDRRVVVGLEGLDAADVRARGVTGGVVGREVDAVGVDHVGRSARGEDAVRDARRSRE